MSTSSLVLGIDWSTKEEKRAAVLLAADSSKVLDVWCFSSKTPALAGGSIWVRRTLPTVLFVGRRRSRERRSRAFMWKQVQQTKSIGVVCRGDYSVTAAVDVLATDADGLPVRISGPTSFHLLAIWTMPRPNYVGSLERSLDRYGDFLKAAPSVVAGDFNSHARFGARRHNHLVDRLREEFGLVSAYHAFRGPTPQRSRLTITSGRKPVRFISTTASFPKRGSRGFARCRSDSTTR